ncbi:MAG: extracellular solute-binding protein [Clostridiales bacterium]|nr:extracellular solute-binding protein [Clostridiales bacterium]
MERNKRFTKLLTVLLTVLICLSLVGCKKDDGKTSKDGSKAVSISVMVWDRGNAAPGTTTEDNGLTQWIKEQVKELYNIDVEYKAVPRSESDNKLNIMMTGGSAPDIVFTYDQNIFMNYANSGALADLTEVYAQYGTDIEKYCGAAQSVGNIGDKKYAVLKQRGTEAPRHVAYVRKDWCDQLDMGIPSTKEELGQYLYAVKENKLGGDNTIPWGMSGRADTEKMYLNFLGSYVDLKGEKDAYIYSEAYMAIAPGSKEGLKQLNTWYNDGLITQDFPTDTSEDVFMADIANGKVGFLLDDVYHPFDSFAVLNTNLGYETFVPVQPFDLPDGSYRTPFEPRHGMYVMIPASASEEVVEACMKYLNWMADPEIATKIRYTPDYVLNDLGVAVEPSAEEKEAKGYPGTCDDLGIVNNDFKWANDYDVLAKTEYLAQATPWASLEWYQNFYKVREIGKYRYPVYSYVSESEQTYGADIKSRMIEFVYRSICAPAGQFEEVYENGYKELVNAGLQLILDSRAEYYDSLNK